MGPLAPLDRRAWKHRRNQPPFGVREGISHVQGSYSEPESCLKPKFNVGYFS
jgi:hypothetical protein